MGKIKSLRKTGYFRQLYLGSKKKAKKNGEILREIK